MSLSTCLDRAQRIERLLVAMAVQQRALGDLLERQLEPPFLRFARQEFLEGQRAGGKPLRALVLDHRRHFVAEAEQAARLQARPPACRARRRARAPRACAPPPCAPGRPCRWRGTCGRSTAAATNCRRAAPVHLIAARREHSERGIDVLALEVAVEGVGEQHDLSFAAAILPGGSRNTSDAPVRQRAPRAEARDRLRQFRRRPAARRANSAATAPSPHSARSAADSRPAGRAATARISPPAPPAPRSSCAPCRRRSGIRGGSPCRTRRASSSPPSRRT